MSVRVAINGFGRIGRAFFRLALERDELEIVAINDLGDGENLAYLLQYDTAYGKYKHNVAVQGDALVVDSKKVQFLSVREPSELPWGDLKIDVVVESTGVFTDYGKANAHRDAGARKVVISAPVKSDAPEGISAATVLMGVNEDKLKTCDISSNASCTTNAGSPVITVLKEVFGIEKALLNTVHGYTATQSIVDGPNKKDFRKGRAAAQNMIPSSTGAAIATTKAVEGLEGKFDGVAIRVPVIVGSMADITALLSKNVTVEEVNDALKNAASSDRWKGIFDATDDPLVSSDIIGNTHASIADLSMTRVVDGNLVKVLTWYDNEMGYSHALVEHVIKTGSPS